ncbi:MAG: hypothetical protein LBM98_06660 [Oscillospiraceae bacterium]|nr:hypothetical protein [Oscillospiraceae bacterium]
MRRDGGRGYVRARRGTPPRRYAAPLPRGEFTGEGGFETRPYGNPGEARCVAPTLGSASIATRVCAPIPLLGGVPPAGGGVVSPAGRNPRPNPRNCQLSIAITSLIFDI